MQAEIATPGIYVPTSGTSGQTGYVPESGGKFWATPKGYGDSAVSKPIGDTAGTKYGSGSSVFTQTTTSGTA